jgi:hypothetical protein
MEEYMSKEEQNKFREELMAAQAKMTALWIYMLIFYVYCKKSLVIALV